MPITEEPNHLLDLVWRVKPRAALFTTYTFSVSHFDAVFLPVLRSVGCQDISVLVDAEQAALCVEEAHSRAAGRVYRIAPVVPPGGGYFHPKLAYLAAETNDVLAVASGNLTASGQSLQLESFDSVSAASAPMVFRELAEWMQQLAALVEGTSPQAARLLGQTVPRARQAHRMNAAAAVAGPLPPPALVHTLGGTAREALEALFIAEADAAETVTVLSPFHAPDGGPVLRLAAAVEAKALAIGLDGGRKQLTAPFEQSRFKPHLPGCFVVADTARNHRRLHAKVFEVQAADRVLVMTGSVNATAQSFESTKNVEVSLARWLPKSPFAWKEVEPAAFEATQEATDFGPGRTLYVDGWLAADRTLHGRVIAMDSPPTSLMLEVLSADVVGFAATAQVDANGAFSAGPVPAFDTSRASMLRVTAGENTATCWLNVHEELDIAAEERERRAAIARVLRGEYAAEDIAEVVRLLTTAAQGLATGAAEPLRRASGRATAEVDVEFSFMRWEASGSQRQSNTFLGRNPYELLRALNRWMNADLSAAAAPSGLELSASQGLKQGVQLVGGSEARQSIDGALADPYALLDQLCQVIPVALERQPGLEHSAVLAEVVASRAVDRALKQDLRMAPCLSWLDRFSRFTYSDEGRKSLGAVAAAMACLTAYRLEREGQDPQLSVLREAVERLAGQPIDADQVITIVEAGLSHELYRRVVGAERNSVLSMALRMAQAATLDDTLIALLLKALTMPRHLLLNEPGAEAFPEVLAALRERRHKRGDLLRGLMNQKALDNKGCPVCYRELSGQQVATLRQRHVLFHKGLRCNQLLLFSDQASRLEQRLKELPDA